MDITLHWHGPFSVVEGQTDQCLFSADPCIVRQCGVYLWTIPHIAEHLVAYVGKTDGATGTFHRRLWTELRSRRSRAWEWIADPIERQARAARPDPWDWIPDVPKLRRGVKAWLYEPGGWAKPNLPAWEAGESRFRLAWRRYLSLLRVFVAPMDDQTQHIRATETALIRAVWDHETALSQRKPVRHFVQNVSEPARLTYPYRVLSVAPVALRGITPVVEGR